MINAMIFHRCGHFFYRHHIPLLPWIMKLLIRLVYNSALDCSTKIGKGTFLAYGGIGVVIHKRAVIGEYVTIGQQVTIGGKSGKEGVPIIGNHVYLGAGAKILGDITIGNHVVVGANSVVLQNVPDYSVVAGVPARIIKQRLP
jgi:serine O-acetyltransferase